MDGAVPLLVVELMGATSEASLSLKQLVRCAAKVTIVDQFDRFQFDQP